MFVTLSRYVTLFTKYLPYTKNLKHFEKSVTKRDSVTNQFFKSSN